MSIKNHVKSKIRWEKEDLKILNPSKKQELELLELIKNTKLEVEEENVNGYCTDKVNLRPEIELPSGIKFGDNLVIQFDRKGRVVSVAKAN